MHNWEELIKASPTWGFLSELSSDEKDELMGFAQTRVQSRFQEEGLASYIQLLCSMPHHPSAKAAISWMNEMIAGSLSGTALLNAVSFMEHNQVDDSSLLVQVAAGPDKVAAEAAAAALHRRRHAGVSVKDDIIANARRAQDYTN